MIKEDVLPSLKESVQELLEQNNGSELSQLLEESSSREIIHLISHLNRDEKTQLFSLISPEDAAEVMEDIPEAQAVDIIEDLETEDAAAILNEMDSDEQADIIKELENEDALAILDMMAPIEAASVRRLLSYEDDTAGGMMHTEYYAFPDTWTIMQVIQDLRSNEESYRYYPLKKVFVIDANKQLRGVLEMQDLLLRSSDSKLADIYLRDFLFIHHQAEFGSLVEFFAGNEYFGVPVVDDDQTLVGVLLRRDVLKEESEKLAMEHLESQGIVGGEELRTMPVFLRARRRLSWLSVNILLNIVAASVIAFHQETLRSVIALAVFLPIISDMSGCSGNQAVAVSMRELSLGVVNAREVLRVFWQEISVGLINGAVLGILIGLAAVLWQGNIYLGIVVGGALMVNTILAVILGGTIPLILKGFNVDPALASSPILTTITDMVGFFLTLTFASMAMAQILGTAG